MARHLSLATAIDKNRIASPNAFITLLEVEIYDEAADAVVEILRFAHNNEDLTYQGQSYRQSAFDFTVDETTDGIPEVSLNVQDPSQEIMARMEEFKGGVGFRVRLKIVNSGNLTQPPEIEELVYVMSSSAKGYVASFTLGAVNPLALRFPRRMQFRDRCSWVYKGRECGYAGPMATCDYSLQGENGCAAHNNTKNFGGFPGIRQR